ncbi:MAG TPA: hypothetical protein O0X70_06305 [Methanocorpusculum sp.]|nr:hypothetical protein [Methanocorpusculum sp.]
MKIKGITLRVPPLLLGVVVFFIAVCAMSYGAEKNILYIAVGLPLAAVLICVPLFMVYSSEKKTLKELPGLRAAAKPARARQITPAMRGMPVVVTGKVVKIGGLMMNKPVYIVEDSSGQVAVRRFALPEQLIGVGAEVEAVGRVYGTLTNQQAIYVNAAEIKPVHHEEVAEETIHIKKYN